MLLWANCYEMGESKVSAAEKELCGMSWYEYISSFMSTLTYWIHSMNFIHVDRFL